MGSVRRRRVVYRLLGLCLGFSLTLWLTTVAIAGDAGEAPPSPENAPSEATPKKQTATMQGALSADAGDVESADGDAGGPSAVGEPHTASASVGRSGALSESYPIAVLPGRAGMTPRLQLTYSSDSHRNGWVGYGWSLDIGSLTRRGRRGQPLPPTSYTADAAHWTSERYHVSVWGHGQELMDDTAKSTGTTHRFVPRYQTHWKVEAPTGGGFDQWQAMDPTGRTYTFRSQIGSIQADSRNVQFLTQITSLDHTNLFVEYGNGTPYVLDGVDIGARAVYPLTIAYSCEQPTDVCYHVRFLWEERDDHILDASSGTLIAWTKRLKEISIETPTGQVAWRYRMIYQADLHNVRSLLHQVSRVTADGTALLPPVTFLYQQNGAPAEAWAEKDTTLDAITYAQQGDGDGIWFPKDGGAIFADINADGLSDQVQRFPLPQSGGMANWINQGDGTFKVSAPSAGAAPAALTRAVRLGDLNGDGRLDLWKNGVPTGLTTTTPDGVVELNGNPLLPAAQLPVKFYDDGGNEQGVQILDVNGDGCADLLQGLRTKSGHLRAAWLFDPTTQQWVAHPAWTPPLDFVADGKATGAQPVDLNGDGLIDFYHMNALDPADNGIYLNNGNGWSDVTSQWSIVWPTGLNTWVTDLTAMAHGSGLWPKLVDAKGADVGWRLVDLNGDRLSDLVLATQYFKQSIVVVLLATADQRFVGTATATLPAMVSRTFHSAQIYGHSYKYFFGQDTGVRFLDVNGDTLPDLIKNVGWLGQPGDIGTKGQPGTVWLNPLPRPANLLVRAYAPLGAWNEFTYQAYAVPGDPIGASRLVVQRTSLHDRGPDGAVLGAAEYHYAQPTLIDVGSPEYESARGPEFLGFREVKRTEIGFTPLVQAGGSYTPGQPSGPTKVTALKETKEEGRRRTTTHYADGRAMVGRLQEQTLEISSDQGQQWTPISKTTHTYHAADHTGVSLTPPYLPLVDTITTTSFEGTPRSVVRQFPEHTLAGDPLHIVDFGRIDLPGDDVNTELSYQYDLAHWILAQPTMVKVSHGTVMAGGMAWRQSLHTYDALGRRISTVRTASHVPDPITTTYAYDDFGNTLTTAVTTGAGTRTTTLTYDPVYHQWPIAMTNPIGHSLQTTYYGINAVEPLASVAAFGQPARRFALAAPGVAAANYTLCSHDAFGRTTQCRVMATADDAVQSTTTWSYLPDATQGTYETTVTTTPDAGTPLSLLTRLDALGRVILGERAQGGALLRIESEYGAYGTLRRLSDPHTVDQAPTWTTTSIDALGRPWATTHAGRTTSYEYGAFVTRWIANDGQVTEEERDGRGRTIRTADGKVVTTIDYAATNEFTTTTIHDPGGAAVIVTTDGLGRVLKRQDPDRGTWTWSYDGWGQMSQSTDAKGESIARTYDALGRVIGIDADGDGNSELRYLYDGATPTNSAMTATGLGRRTGMIDATGKATYSYNARGELTWTTKQIGKEKYGLALSYDPIGRISEARYSQAVLWAFPTPLCAVRYTYDPVGMTRLEYQIGTASTWQDGVSDIERDVLGRPALLHFGNGAQRHDGYEPVTGRLVATTITSSSGTALLDFAYGYDPVTGRLNTITDGLDPAYSQTLTYDGHGRLTGVAGGKYYGWQYYATPAGNLENYGPWTLHYDAAQPHAARWTDQEVTKATRLYAYDLNGNAVNAAGTTFLYDRRHQITQIASNLGQMNFGYDGDGARVREVVTLAAGAAPVALPTMPPMAPWDPATLPPDPGTRPSATTPVPTRATSTPAPRGGTATAPGAVGKAFGPLGATSSSTDRTAAAAMVPTGTTQTTIRPFADVEIVTGSGPRVTKEIRLHLSALGQRIAEIRIGAKGTATARYLYTDHLGSVVAVANADGSLVSGSLTGEPRLHYGPFGLPIDHLAKPFWANWPDPRATYLGIPALPIAPLYLAGPRLYDPLLGRFLQPDPIPGPVLVPEARNPYSYARNNPILYRDPSGLQAVGIGERMEVGDSAPTGFSFSASYSSADGNHQSQFGGDPGAYQSYTGPNSGSGKAYARSAGAAKQIYGAEPYIDYGMMYQPDSLYVDPYAEETIAADDWMQYEVISNFDAMDLIARTLNDYGVHPDDIPNTEFWPELAEATLADYGVRAVGLYEQYGEYGYGSTKDWGYGNPTLYLGDKFMTISTVLHELGHHLDMGLNILNTSNALDHEFVADMFAVGQMTRNGILPGPAAIGYKRNLTGFFVAAQKCGGLGSLGTCEAFWTALADGDAGFFDPDTRIPFLRPKLRDKLNAIINGLSQ